MKVTGLRQCKCRMALVEAERALEHWAMDEDSLEGQGAVIWRTAQVPSLQMLPACAGRGLGCNVGLFGTVLSRMHC